MGVQDLIKAVGYWGWGSWAAAGTLGHDVRDRLCSCGAIRDLIPRLASPIRASCHSPGLAWPVLFRLFHAVSSVASLAAV